MHYVLVRRYDDGPAGESVEVDLFRTKKAAVEQMKTEYEGSKEHFESLGKRVSSLFLDDIEDYLNMHHLARAAVFVSTDDEKAIKKRSKYENTVQWDVFEALSNKAMMEVEKKQRNAK